jgi:DNA-binding transcriptional LysR family regulator
MGRRLDALEEHLGVKLWCAPRHRPHARRRRLPRDCQRLLADVANAEASVSAGGVRASGHLRVTAPAGFGRRRSALVPRFGRADRSDALAQSQRPRGGLGSEGFDCAVRVGDLPDSSLVSVRVADNRRLCVATPEYLQRNGTPRHPSELVQHDCLTLSSEASQTRGWAFRMPTQAGGAEVVHLKPAGPMDCSDGQVLYDWCLAGHGIAWRSTWEVEGDIAAGRLVAVLEDFAAPPNGIYVLFRSASICRCGCACGLIFCATISPNRRSGRGLPPPQTRQRHLIETPRIPYRDTRKSAGLRPHHGLLMLATFMTSEPRCAVPSGEPGRGAAPGVGQCAELGVRRSGAAHRAGTHLLGRQGRGLVLGAAFAAHQDHPAGSHARAAGAGRAAIPCVAP